MQHPILTGHNGGGGGGTADEDAYRLIVGACETALTTLVLSDSCEIALRRVARCAQAAGRLPAQELRRVPVRRLG